jgi:hypothetical protein
MDQTSLDALHQLLLLYLELQHGVQRRLALLQDGIELKGKDINKSCRRRQRHPVGGPEDHYQNGLLHGAGVAVQDEAALAHRILEAAFDDGAH